MDEYRDKFKDLESKTDQEIAVLVQKDKEAFAVLIRRYEKALIRYVTRLGISNEEDRVDIIQNAFIKAYKNILSFDTSLTFSTWLYRIAHNEAISFFRSKKVRPEGHMVENAEEFLDRIYDDAEKADIAEEINKKFNASELNQALLKIDNKYREVLVLRYFEERDYSEISDILEIPSGSVATLIHRAKKQLAKHVEHLHVDEDKVKNKLGLPGLPNISHLSKLPKFSDIPYLPKIPDIPFMKKKEIKVEEKDKEKIK